MGPIASALAGIAVANISAWCYQQLTHYIPHLPFADYEQEKKEEKKDKKTSKIKISQPTPLESATAFYHSAAGSLSLSFFLLLLLSCSGKAVRFGLALFLIWFLLMNTMAFVGRSRYYAEQISQPSLMFKSRLRNGEEIIVDDYVV